MASRRTVSRLCECQICGAEEITNRTVLPAGWAITWEHEYTLCKNCIRRWRERFGSEPAYVEEGDSIYEW